MDRVAIVTDSSAYMPTELLDQYKISVAPQVLIWGTETFADGVDILPAQFYQRLGKATVMPSTSQASIISFENIFRKLLDDGYAVLAVLISEKLSGTIASATQAKASVGGLIEIVDSQTTSMAMGFQVLAAARAAAEGHSLKLCKAIVEEVRPRTGVLVTVDTLEFLHRGGRIGGAQRFLGTALNIKPIIEVAGGKLEGVEKVRTRRKAVARLLDLVAERTGGDKPLRLAAIHANVPDDAQELLDLACERFQVIEKYIAEVSPVIGTHVGPGTLGITWMVG
jgi:DegV family protein with EDD domain